MNDRIKDLAQTVNRIRDLYNIGPVHRDAVEQFAELIVRECDKVQSELLAIAILDNWGDELCADNIKRTARYLQSNSFAKYFGVER